MRNFYNYINHKLLAFAMVLFVFSACPNVFQTPKESHKKDASNSKALVSIIILNNQLRSVLPDFNEGRITNYRLFGSIGAGGETLLTSFTSPAGAAVSLQQGTWNFTLEACDAENKAILMGKVADRVIAPNGDNSVSFTLLPLNFSTGSIAITLQFPAGADINKVTALCGEDAPVDLVITHSSTQGTVQYLALKTADSYFISFRLYTGEKLRAVVSEKVLVRGNVTSQKTIVLSMANLKPLNTEERFIRANMAAPGDGSSWETASDDIQKMMDEVYTALRTGADKAIVYVAAGTYTPKYWPKEDGSTDYADYTEYSVSDLEQMNRGLRDRTFMLRPGVELLGGYAANGETISDAQRKSRFDSFGKPSSEAYRAVLSGDFLGNDSGSAMNGFTGMEENAFHVVLGVDIPNDGKTVVDGVTVSGGCADIVRGININTKNGNGNINGHYGAGIYNLYSSQVLVNVTITGNYAYYHGSGIYNLSSSPILTNVTVSNTIGSSFIYNSTNTSSIFISTIISSNYGDGIRNNYSSPILNNVIISDNLGGDTGIRNSYSSPLLNNVIISGNLYYDIGNSSIFNNNSSPKIRNSIIYSNSGVSISGSGSPSVSHSIIEGGWDGPNIDIDPLFANPAAGDYRLQAGSFAINAGNYEYYPDTWEKWLAQFDVGSDNPISREVYEKWVRPALAKDAAGNDRVKGGAIDIGAYEEPGGISPNIEVLAISDIVPRLISQLGGNSVDNPINMSIGVQLTEANWLAILNAINTTGKFINLNLSSCTRSSSSTGGGLRSDGTFDSSANISTGKYRIVSIVLPDAAASIVSGSGNYSFSNNFTNLKSASGANIISISGSAFGGCTSLTTVSFPAAASIGDGAFFGCANLTSFILNGSGDLSVAEGGRALVRTVPGGKELIAYPSASGIIEMNDITSIGYGAFFDCTSLTTANFPEAISIGYGAFSGCTSLATVSFPATASIGGNAFAECTSLTTVSFPAAASIGDGAFCGCVGLVEASFPLVTSIGWTAFGSCTSLTTANFPAAASTGGNAFVNCSNLTSVNFPLVTSIDLEAFRDCRSLTSVNFPLVTSIGHKAFSGCRSLTSVSFPAVTAIGFNIFEYCIWLDTAIFLTVTPPNIIDSYLFYDAHSNLRIVVPTDSVEAYRNAVGWKEYAGRIIGYTPGTSEVEGDNIFTPIYYSVDLQLTEANWVSILSHIETSGKYVNLDLSNCTRSNNSTGGGLRSDGTFDPISSISNGKDRIVSIVLPDSAVCIVGGFNRFNNLIMVSGANILTIDNSAFSGCRSLTSANFPLATSIGFGAFSGCSLTSANFPLATSIGFDAFSYNLFLIETNFPLATSIGEYAFNGCSLTSANFPLATSIGAHAFSGCSLTSANFPLATSIGNGAFSDCLFLVEANFPLATSIGNYAFNVCRSLNKVIIAAGLTSFGSLPTAFQTAYNNAGQSAGTYLLVGEVWVKEE